jgi:hypothetical protein
MPKVYSSESDLKRETKAHPNSILKEQKNRATQQNQE